MLDNPKIIKGRDGWRGEAELPMGFENSDGEAVLKISLSKQSGSLCGFASVAFKSGNTMRHMLFQDFTARLRIPAPTRVTEKAISRAWQAHVVPWVALGFGTDVPPVLKRAADHYGVEAIEMEGVSHG